MIRTKHPRTTIPLLSRLLPVAIGLCALAACTYVTPEEREAHYDQLDEDKDGALKGGKNKDCDDADATRFPANPEIPYNGIDDDCDKIDLIDQDGDGYPGVVFEAYTAEFPDQTWPAGIKEGPIDCADDPAVIAEAAEIYPTRSDDAPYDGLDADCAGDNDFDADGDGDMPPKVNGADTQPLFEAYQDTWGLSFTSSFGDCDDFDADVSSLQTSDEWYDGIDSDCAGNNDFDQDADGYMPDEDLYGADYLTFLEFYHDGVAPESWGESLFGDCMDADNADLPGVDPATANPGETETWYDGVDNDCDGDNDYDQDGDGYIEDQYYPAAFDEYVADWEYSLQAEDGECDDLDATVNPGALEILDDAIDQDCDAGQDTTPFGYGAMEWTSPRPPALVSTDEHYILVAGADNVAYGAVAPDNVGLALIFERTSTVDATYTGSPIIWRGPSASQVLGQGLDAESREGRWWAATTYDSGAVTSLIAVDYEWEALSQAYTRGALDHSDLPTLYTNTDVELAIDDRDEPWAWAVSADVLHVLRGDGTAGADEGALLQGVAGGTVFVTDPDDQNTGTGTICDGTDCATYEFNGIALSLAASQDWAGETYVDTDNNAGTLVLANVGTGVWVDDGATSYLVANDEHASSADASWIGNTLYVATIFDDGNGSQARLSYGDPAVGPLTSVAFPVEDPNLVTPRILTPLAIAVHADSNRVMLAISADGDTGVDAIGWAFLGL